MCGWEAGRGRPSGLCVLGSEPGGVGPPGSELPLEQQPLSVLSQWRLQVISKTQAKEVGREPHTSSLLPNRPRGSHRRQPPGTLLEGGPHGISEGSPRRLSGTVARAFTGLLPAPVGR